MMAINPFKFIDGLYGDDIVKNYKNLHAKDLPAHVYIIASRAYFNLMATEENQSILISGESGSGKTEATKHCLDFLTKVAVDTSDVVRRLEEINEQSKGRSMSLENASKVLASSGKRYSINTTSAIAGRIIAASPVLEAFGNAQTVCSEYLDTFYFSSMHYHMFCNGLFHRFVTRIHQDLENGWY
jgi:myosin protein heavy chain